MEALSLVLAFLIVFPVVAVLITVECALVLVQLWHWFVVPTFHLAELTTAQAAGLALIVAMLTYRSPESQHKDKDGDEDYAALGKLIGQFAVPILFLFLGWIIQHWMAQ